MNEILERRVFGAIEFVDDLTDTRVRDPLHIRAPGVGWLRNRSGLYVIRELDGHAAYTRQFDDAPSTPVRSDFSLQVEDPRGRYLPRTVALSLPRLLGTPASPVADADDVFWPVRIRLWPAAALPVRAQWAILRLTLEVAGTNPPQGLANVIVETRPQVAGLLVQHTMTDRHGDALIVIAGAPPVLPDGGPAGLTREFSAGVTLVLDSQVVRSSAAKAAPPIPDPARVLRRRDEQHAEVRTVALQHQVLSAGATRRHVEKVTWP